MAKAASVKMVRRRTKVTAENQSNERMNVLMDGEGQYGRVFIIADTEETAMGRHVE